MPHFQLSSVRILVQLICYMFLFVGFTLTVPFQTTSVVSRKRKSVGSVIGSVVLRNYSEDEEEYDPHKPLIGRVASTVRVEARK